MAAKKPRSGSGLFALTGPRPLTQLTDYLGGMIRGRLWAQVLVGMVLGIGTGILLGPTVGWLPAKTAATLGSWIALPGHLFLALIQMIVIPLVVASVIRGLAATENPAQLKRLGGFTLLYFVTTTAVAILIGIWVALVIEPGRFLDSAEVARALGGKVELPSGAEITAPTLRELPERMLSLVPRNPLSSMVQGQMLQVVLFTVVVGVALVMMPRVRSRPLLDLMASLQEVCMTVVRWAMWLAPFAVFGLLAQLVMRIGLDALAGMAVYVATVLAGLTLLLALYLVLVTVLVRESPLRFLGAVRELLLLAFSTSSSAAVMPLTIKTAQEKLGVRPSVAQFVIPLGAGVNMNGTALYQGVATIFLAQVFGIDLGTGAMAAIVVTAVGASLGSSGTPGVGIIILALVLDTVGIPAAGIALIMGVDRILDMARTAINVCGDIVAARLVDQWVAAPPRARTRRAATR